MEEYKDHDDFMDTTEAKKYRIRKQELRTPSPKTKATISPSSTQKKKKRDGALFPSCPGP